MRVLRPDCEQVIGTVAFLILPESRHLSTPVNSRQQKSYAVSAHESNESRNRLDAQETVIPGKANPLLPGRSGTGPVKDWEGALVPRWEIPRGKGV